VFFAESRISLSILMPLTHPKGIQDAILRVGDACKTAYSANIDKNCGVELYGWIFGFSVKTIGSGLSGRLMAKWW